MKKKFYLLASLLLVNSVIFGQEYLNMIEQGTFPVQEVIESAETYFADKDKGRGSGYKQFKRWEYMAERLMDDQGYLTPINEQLSELERYNAYLNETAENRLILEDNWTELGPTYKNGTSGWNPGVGRVTGFYVDKNSVGAQHIIIGANTGGVWRTIDGGDNWTPLCDDFSNMFVYSVVMDPTNSETYFFGSSNGLIYKSEDSGATWSQLGQLGSGVVNKLLIDPTNTDVMFASLSQSGLYKSDDGGDTWTQVLLGDSYDMEFQPGNTSIVYASGEGFHKSDDGGNTFQQITGFGGGAKMIGVSEDDNTIVYVLEASSGSFGGFYKSDDSGDSFTELNHSGRNYFGYDIQGFESGGQAPRDMDIAVNPNDVNEVHIAGILTWRSFDGGVNFQNTADWTPGGSANAGVGYHHADVDILEFVDGALFVGSDGGLFKAADTENLSINYYEDLTNGLGIRQFYKIGISQTENTIITGGSQDNGSSVYNDEDEVWKDWLGADGMEGFVDKTNSDIIYGTSQFGFLHRSENGGNSLSGINTPVGGQFPGNWVTPFEQDPVSENTIYGGYNAVYKSTNKGVSWSTISQTFPAKLDEMKIAPSNNNVIYASRAGVLYKTTDGGATDWQQMTSPGGTINTMAVHPQNPNKIVVAVSGAFKVRLSEDGGETWSTLSTGLPSFSALAVVWDLNGQDGLYLGMNYGVYYIDNTFAEWQPYSNNIPNVIINELEINYETGMLYAGSYGRGLWVSPTKLGTILSTENFISSEIVTLYPNPAQSEVTLNLPRAVEADVRVFDINGKLLTYHANEEILNDYSLDVSQLGSGVYFIRLNTNFGTITKRFIKE